jgi:glycosyltransferase involved in cell wall biosynthesis
MNVKYVGPARDYSGYGEAVRHDIAALLAAGVEVRSLIPSYVMEFSDFGTLGQRVLKTENNPLPYDVVILHTTPNVYGKYFEEGKYHIARVFWETDKLPEDFMVNIRKCQEVWTGSRFNKQALEKQGVTAPIFVIPEAIDTDLPKEIPPFKVSADGSYKFYSIFEWTERKDPESLLTAYWLEFENTPGVSLTIKTYLDNFSRVKKLEIDAYIQRVKDKLRLKHYAPLYLYRALLDRTQMYRFHSSFDCFVSAHRGEGWGIPQMEAMLLGKPIISTNLGGIHEYLKHQDEALLCNYEMVPLSGNNRNQHWYGLDQNWGKVFVNDLRQNMRFAFDNPEKTGSIGEWGSKRVRELFSLEAVGDQMLARLEEIHGA